MKKFSIASLLSLFISTAALAQSMPAAAPAVSPAPAAQQEPETLVGRPRATDAVLTGWFIAPTFQTTRFADTVAYGPGLRAGVYLNRRFAIGGTMTVLGLQESQFDDHRATNVGAYGGLLLQYVVQSNRLVHVTLESTLARGRWCTEIGDGEQGTHDGCNGRSFVAFEPVANIEVNVARHVRVATGVGYRFAAATASGEGPGSDDMSGIVARTSLVLGSF
jgi:hypothetical protein